MVRGPIFTRAWVVAATLSAAGGCAGTKQQASVFLDGGAGAAGTAGTAGRDAAIDNGGVDGIGGFPTTDGRVIGTDALGDAACAVATQTAQKVPLDLYIMMDSSGSMSATVAGNQTKWDAVRSALTTFLGDPQVGRPGGRDPVLPVAPSGRPRRVRDRRPVRGASGRATSSGRAARAPRSPLSHQRRLPGHGNVRAPRRLRRLGQLLLAGRSRLQLQRDGGRRLSSHRRLLPGPRPVRRGRVRDARRRGGRAAGRGGGARSTPSPSTWSTG